MSLAQLQNKPAFINRATFIRCSTHSIHAHRPFSVCALHFLERKGIKYKPAASSSCHRAKKKKDSDVWSYYPCAPRMCCAHAAECESALVCECLQCTLLFFRVWLKGGTAETPSWILHPVIFPSSARALGGEGGAVTSLPRTTAAEGGHLVTEVSAKEWLRLYKLPPTPPRPTNPPPSKNLPHLQALNRLELNRSRWGTLRLLPFTHTNRRHFFFWNRVFVIVNSNTDTVTFIISVVYILYCFYL